MIVCIFNALKNKLTRFLSIIMLGISLFFPFSPTAEASIFEALISTGIQYAIIEKQISRLNDEGRHEVFESLKQKYGVNEDPELNAFLDDIMTNLITGIAKTDPTIYDKPYNYFINNEKTFNAFCSLGHNLSVNTGLFDLINDESEIAVVLAHEIAHGQKNHVIKGFRKSIPIALGATVISESTGGIEGAVLGTIVNNQLNSNQISKPQEWEADNLAFDYIAQTDYNIGACAAIWQRVMEKMDSSEASNFVGEIFSPSDHPSCKERRDNYAKKLTKYSKKSVVVDNETISINGVCVLKTAPDNVLGQSAAERSYFIAGNLAKVFHNDSSPKNFYVEKNSLFCNGIYIFTENSGEPTVNDLVDAFTKASLTKKHKKSK